MNTPPVLPRKEFEFTREDFDFLRQVVSETTGIVSSEDKYTMYYSRLARRLRALGLSDFKAYREYLGRNSETESIELVNSVTTNLTSFFRENHHFEYLRDVLIPALRDRGQRRLRIPGLHRQPGLSLRLQVRPRQAGLPVGRSGAM